MLESIFVLLLYKLPHNIRCIDNLKYVSFNRKSSGIKIFNAFNTFPESKLKTIFNPDDERYTFT